MMTALEPWTPKGDVAEWRLIYNRLTDPLPQVGRTITFSELTDALGRDFHLNRGPLYRAQQELLEEHKLALTPVRGKGYRVVHAREHGDLARKNHKSARRKIQHAVAMVTHVDQSVLTPQERTAINSMAVALRSQAVAIRRLDQRVERLEKAVDSYPGAQDFEHLQRRLEALERRQPS